MNAHGAPAGWAELAVVQAAAGANRHVSVGQKLGGAVLMPQRPTGGDAEGMSVELLLAEMATAVAAQHPNRAERCLLAALDAGAGHGATPPPPRDARSVGDRCSRSCRKRRTGCRTSSSVQSFSAWRS